MAKISFQPAHFAGTTTTSSGSGSFSTGGATLPVVRLSATFNIRPSTAPTLTLARTLGNKRHTFVFTHDDGSALIGALASVLVGGRSFGGKTYGGLSYDDGCGKQIRPALSLALSGEFLNQGTGSIIPNRNPAPNPTFASWAALADVQRRLGVRGVGYINHSWSHGNPDANGVSGKTGAKYQLQKNRDEFLARTGRFMHTTCPPSGLPAFVQGSVDLGRTMGIQSQGWGADGTPAGKWADGLDPYINMLEDYQTIGTLLERVTPTGFVMNARSFLDYELRKAAAIGINRPNYYLDLIKSYIDQGVAFGNANLGGHYLHSFFGHVPDWNDTSTLPIIEAVLQYILEQGEVWIPHFPHLCEWLNVCKLAKIGTPIVSADELTYTWDIDLSAVPTWFEFNDMTLLCGAALTSVQVWGAEEYTSNLQKGMVNIYKRLG